jgi:hypothetical protein
MNKLTLNLVPSTMWYLNLRKILTNKSWKNLTTECFNLSNNVCEICGMTGIYNNGKIKLECHEEWEFDEVNKIQKLKKLLALCVMCHRTKHAGLWFLKGKRDSIIKHLMFVNKLSKIEAIDLVNKEFINFEERSQFYWNLDIKIIKNNPLFEIK